CLASNQIGCAGWPPKSLHIPGVPNCVRNHGVTANKRHEAVSRQIQVAELWVRPAQAEAPQDHGLTGPEPHGVAAGGHPRIRWRLAAVKAIGQQQISLRTADVAAKEPELLCHERRDLSSQVRRE